MTTMHTPWGPPQEIEELAEGVWRVSTASHGGLKLSRERWSELPAAVRRTMLTPAFAEEDCEDPIVRTLLGLGGDREREAALRTAAYFDRYAPALPYLRGEGLGDGVSHVLKQHLKTGEEAGGAGAVKAA